MKLIVSSCKHQQFCVYFISRLCCDNHLVSPWKSAVVSASCLSFDDGESVCVLDNRSDSV
jgi:hypothetical protein